jgi:hypothetical protein
MRIEQVAPTAVADLARPLGRPDDVGEEQRDQDAGDFRLRGCHRL